MRFVALITVFLMCLTPPALAQGAAGVEKAYRTSGLPVPRFVSLRSDKAFVRSGPGLRYPIKWVFEKEDLPVEIIQEFDTWRKIRGPEGDEGWVHQTLISGQRTALIQTNDLADLHKDPDDNARIIAKAENGVIAELLRCSASFCEVSADGYRGWIARKNLYGVYASEEFK